MNSKFAIAHSCQGAHRAVLDTQAVLDWLYFNDPSTALWETWRQAGQWRWVAGAALRDELAHVLARAELPPSATVTDKGLLAAFDARVQWLPDPTPALVGPLRCTDTDDQKFIDFALAHRVRWLVSRDRAVLKLRRRALADHGLLILPPAQWQPQAANA